LEVALRRISPVVAAFVLGACSHAPMNTSDSHIRADEAAPTGSVPPPVQISSILPKPKPTPQPETYSVVVNGVRVQELLFALARDAKLNIDVHPGISGGVTLNAIDQTLPQLLSRIAKQVDMRWELDGPNLVVMPDSPYLRIYKIDYVNMERDTQGTVGVSTQIATPGSSAGGGGAGGAAGTNASSTTVRNTANNKFWVTLVENIKDILRETDKVIPGAGVSGTPATPPAPGTVPGALPGSTGLTPASTPNVTFREAASVIANPEAGVLTIRATSRQHEKIQEFLDQVLVNARRQVLIEATIAEVQLNNQYQQGIDWSLFTRGTAGFQINQGNATPNTVTPSGVNQSVFTLAYTASGISATIRLLESFGNVRVLSSPKLSVVNNQTAILKVVDNRVYFTISATTVASANAPAVTTFSTTPNVVPVGFVMNVTPQIADNNTVLLNVRPTLSRIIDFVNDPNPNLANPCGVGFSNCNIAPVISKIPEIQTREMESLIKINSGQIAVMGGLIQDSINDVEDTIPGLSQIPGIGTFFTQRNKTNTKTELVIFLRPVVVKDPSIDGDFRAYRTLLPGEDFMSQPNPGKSTPLSDSAR
jgi:general secretion pathway protein D